MRRRTRIAKGRDADGGSNNRKGEQVGGGFIKAAGLIQLKDGETAEGVMREIRGDTSGLEERIAELERAVAALAERCDLHEQEKQQMDNTIALLQKRCETYGAALRRYANREEWIAEPPSQNHDIWWPGGNGYEIAEQALRDAGEEL